MIKCVKGIWSDVISQREMRSYTECAQERVGCEGSSISRVSLTSSGKQQKYITGKRETLGGATGVRMKHVRV